MECIGLENDGDEGIILNKVLTKFFSNFENLELLEDSNKLETRGCMVSENLWECVDLKLLNFVIISKGSILLRKFS